MGVGVVCVGVGVRNTVLCSRAFVRTFVLLMETLASCREDFLFGGLSLSLQTKSPSGTLRAITIPVRTNIPEMKQTKILS